jgi:hypothetical protein
LKKNHEVTAGFSIAFFDPLRCLPLHAMHGVGATSRSYHFSNPSSLMQSGLPLGSRLGNVLDFTKGNGKCVAQKSIDLLRVGHRNVFEKISDNEISIFSMQKIFRKNFKSSGNLFLFFRSLMASRASGSERLQTSTS